MVNASDLTLHRPPWSWSEFKVNQRVLHRAATLDHWKLTWSEVYPRTLVLWLRVSSVPEPLWRDVGGTSVPHRYGSMEPLDGFIRSLEADYLLALENNSGPRTPEESKAP